MRAVVHRYCYRVETRFQEVGMLSRPGTTEEKSQCVEIFAEQANGQRNVPSAGF